MIASRTKLPSSEALSFRYFKSHLTPTCTFDLLCNLWMEATSLAKIFLLHEKHERGKETTSYTQNFEPRILTDNFKPRIDSFHHRLWFWLFFLGFPCRPLSFDTNSGHGADLVFTRFPQIVEVPEERGISHVRMRLTDNSSQGSSSLERWNSRNSHKTCQHIKIQLHQVEIIAMLLRLSIVRVRVEGQKW